MTFKYSLLATSAVVAAVSFAASASAQTASGTAAAASSTIEELVVTAEKRSQNLQDVPVAISAFTSEKRDLIGITSIQDMTNFTPGLQYSSQLDRTSLRGLGRLTNEHTAQGAVAVYSDGIYTTSTVEAGKPSIFTDRVEVLRGPQGTLYGRNAIGGAINVISKRPTEDWYAEGRLAVENYDHTILSAAVSGPTVIPGVQFRLAGSWDKQSEGWIKNVVPGMPDEGNVIDTKIIEGQLKMHFNDRFDGWMKLAAYQWNNGAGGPGSRATWTPAPYPMLQYYNAGITLNPGYACNPRSGATNVHNVSPLGCTNPALTDPRKIASDAPYQVSLQATTIFASEWVYHFDDMDLKYTAGGTHYHYTLTGPQPVDETAPIASFSLPFISAAGVIPGAVPILPRYGFKYEEVENWISHEVNLASTDKGPFQWLVGAYYYSEGFQQPVSTTLLDEPKANGPFVAPTCFFSNPATGACTPTSGQQRIYDDRPVFDVESRALYGQVDWEFAEHWKTTLGLRYSTDHEKGTEAIRLLCMDVAACLANPPSTPVGVGPELAGNFLIDLTQIPTVVGGYTGPLPSGVTSHTTVDPATGFATRNYNAKWSATTGTAGLQWEPDRDTNVYLRYSRGYKAGGLRVGIDTTLGPAPNSAAEHANAYEFGIKKDFGRTLQTNLALFYYDYSNTQVPIAVANTSGALTAPQNIFYNVPKALSQGVELETIWAPIDNLQLMFNYSYLDAHITDSGAGVVDPADPAALALGAKPLTAATACTVSQPAGPTGGPTFTGNCDVFTGINQRNQNLAGNHLPNAPKNKVAVNVNYTWDFAPGSLIGSLSYIWRDAQYGSIFDRSYYRSPSYAQVDGRLTWKSHNNKYTVILYGRNLFNTLGYEGGAGAYRRAGFEPGFAAGTSASPFVAPVVEGVVSTYPITPPRTYGIELQYRFF